jgi:hypothetical protein
VIPSVNRFGPSDREVADKRVEWADAGAAGAKVNGVVVDGGVEDPFEILTVRIEAVPVEVGSVAQYRLRSPDGRSDRPLDGGETRVAA